MRPLKRSILPVVCILLGFFTGWYFGYTRPIGKQYAALQQQYAELRQELTKQSQRAAPNWQVEQDAQPLTGILTGASGRRTRKTRLVSLSGRLAQIPITFHSAALGDASPRASIGRLRS